MAEFSIRPHRLPQSSTGGFFLLILFVALAFGWVFAGQRAGQERQYQERLRRYTEEEISRARDELQIQTQGMQPNGLPLRRGADLGGSNLTGITITSDRNVFQRASFRDCRLEDATLIGGNGSFQLAHFEAAKLARATLEGGDLSFSMSSFAGADLTDATLAGGTLSFQKATFEKAILIGAALSGDFQVVNINGARLEAADLSAIDRDNLASWYFKEPPTYDAQTKFPPRFDPVKHSWKRTD